MKEKIEKIKNNKPLKVLGNILYVFVFIVVVFVLFVVALQRFSNNSISLGGVRIFSVATGSMVPKYEIGDILIAKETDPKDLNVGDDIAYQGKVGGLNGKVVTHEIISIEQNQDGNYKIITKGKANIAEDPEIDQTQVQGKIIYKVQSLSLISKLISNVYIFYFLIFIPIALIIFKWIRSIASNKDDKGE